MPGSGESGGNALVGVAFHPAELAGLSDLQKARVSGVFRGRSFAPRGDELDRLAFLGIGRARAGTGAAGETAPFLAVGPLEEEVQQGVTAENTNRQKNRC